MQLNPWRNDNQTDQNSNNSNQGGGDDNSDPRYLGPPIHSDGSDSDNHPVGFQQPQPQAHDDLPKHPGAGQIGFNPVSQIPPGQLTSQEHRQDEEHKSDSGSEHQHQFGGGGVASGDQHPPRWIGPPVHDGGQNQPGSHAGHGYNPSNPHPEHNPIPPHGADSDGGQTEHSENDISGVTHSSKGVDGSWKARHNHTGDGMQANNGNLGVTYLGGDPGLNTLGSGGQIVDTFPGSPKPTPNQNGASDAMGLNPNSDKIAT